MARKKMIPDDVRERVIVIVNQFNEENVKPAEPSPVQKNSATVWRSFSG